MRDPYTVLGVSPSATDEAVKKAYRELARKYHPDNYQNNPLADLAEEKMKEINEAYDTITKQRSGEMPRSGGYGGGYQQGYASNPTYGRVRNLINVGDLTQAEQLLYQVGQKDGEWYFLSGSIAYRRGWLDEAMQNYSRAVPPGLDCDAAGKHGGLPPRRLWRRNRLYGLLYHHDVSQLPV